MTPTCGRGHVLTEENTYIRPDNGLLECRACRALMAKASRERLRDPQKPRRIRDNAYPAVMVCLGCGVGKSIAEFDWHDPKRRYRNRSCRACVTQRDRNTRLQKLYGITVAELVAMNTAQGGKCALCGGVPRRHMSGWPEMPMWSVDHDHKTGRVRGLLCQPCNVDVGFVETRFVGGRLARIERYLEES